jgi:hypothetical protein
MELSHDIVSFFFLSARLRSPTPNPSLTLTANPNFLRVRPAAGNIVTLFLFSFQNLSFFQFFYRRPKGTKLWTHTQLSPMPVNTMKGHTCNMKRSQKTFEPRANKQNLSHTSLNVIHTIRTSHTQVGMSHTKKSNFLRGGLGKLAC